MPNFLLKVSNIGDIEADVSAGVDEPVGRFRREHHVKLSRLAFAAIAVLGCGAPDEGGPGTGGTGGIGATGGTGGAVSTGGSTMPGAAGAGLGGTSAAGGASSTGAGGGGNGAAGGAAGANTAGTGGGAGTTTTTGSGGVGATGGTNSGGAGAVGGGRAGASAGSGGVAGGSGGGGGSAGGTGGGTGGTTAGDVPLDATLMSRCTGSNPIRCTIPVASDGNYNVTVELGGAAASSSRVQAELYRIVIPTLALPAGTYSRQTFSVNVRAEKHDGYSAPGKVLDLLIDGSAPALHGLGVASAAAIATLFVAGDSTVCDWDPALATIIDVLERGWAQELSQFLKPGIAVANYGDSGETAGGFYTKFFPQARDAMRAGDTLFIQFGHNDQKDQASIDGYKSNLMKYITDARAKGATPVLFTPVARKGASTANPGFAGLDQQVRELAAAQNVALVDLTTLAIAHYKTVANLSALFAAGDSTHFSETGATQIAALVVNDLKTGALPLTAFIK